MIDFSHTELLATPHGASHACITVHSVYSTQPTGTGGGGGGGGGGSAGLHGTKTYVTSYELISGPATYASTLTTNLPLTGTPNVFTVLAGISSAPTNATVEIIYADTTRTFADAGRVI